MKHVITGVASVLVALAVFVLGFSPKPVATPPFAGAGSEFFSLVQAHEGIVVGGKVIASSTAATETLAATDINGVSVLNLKAAAAATVTLPSKSVLSGIGFLPNAGDSQTVTIHASTSAVTLAGATGVTLYAASSTKINAGQTGVLRFTRLQATEGSTYEAVLLNY